MKRSDVVALYVDPRGPYPGLLEEWYDETRDARTYAGPWPVVAHPPCGPWGALRHMVVPNRARREQDAALGPIAIQQVQRWGGVLEQPKGSKLFAHCGVDPRECFTVEQVQWGHVARKATWLYVVGVDRARVTEMIYPWTRVQRTPTHWVSGGRKQSRKGTGGVVPVGIKVCSAQQRRRTPLAFAQWLIELAAQARV
jgi:hypothetical protein